MADPFLLLEVAGGFDPRNKEGFTERYGYSHAVPFLMNSGGGHYSMPFAPLVALPCPVPDFTCAAKSFVSLLPLPETYRLTV